jgi:hypothetical protein
MRSPNILRSYHVLHQGERLADAIGLVLGELAILDVRAREWAAIRAAKKQLHGLLDQQEEQLDAAHAEIKRLRGEELSSHDS